MWLEMSVETFVFIFGAWSSLSPKVWIHLKKVGWGGKKGHLLTQHGLQ